MIGDSLVVQSYILVNDGCPLSATREGTGHVTIRFGGSNGQNFEIVAQYEALRALVQLGNDALEEIDSVNPDASPVSRGRTSVRLLGRPTEKKSPS